MTFRNDIKGPSPQALPSWYRGIEFRSRMEARWAAYFDLLELEWIYEPEGYALPNGNYCPDFQVERMICEVKPTEEAALSVLPKLVQLYQALDEQVSEIFCLIGNPSVSEQWTIYNEPNQCNDYYAIQGRFTWLAFVYKRWGVPDYCDSSRIDYQDEYNLRLVYSLRFENGLCNQDFRGKGYPANGYPK